ncbi:MAG: DUF2807 domain-containing protein [Chloroflexi bacterium]|nr:DUF2807 domain-containing protein [Chloroflexota bacterium]
MIKALFLLIPVILLMGTSLGCDINEDSIKGSGDVITIKKDFSGFTKVDLAHTVEATIVRADSFSVVIKIDDNLEKYLNTKMVGDTLKIYLDSGHHYKDETIEAEITMPFLDELELSGATRADIAGFISDHDLDINISGASKVSGNIVASDTDFDISGASKLNLEGSGENLKVKTSGASDVDLGDFIAKDVDISLSGASDGTVNLNGTLEADVSGASKLRYYGNPTMGDIDTSGASSIKKVE